MNVADSQPSESIFLCYRREDSNDVTMRLHDNLEHLLGKESVFADVTSITPGLTWPQHIRERLERTQVVLIIIGRDWLRSKLPRLRR